MIQLIKQIVKNTILSVLSDVRVSLEQSRSDSAREELETLKKLYEKLSSEVTTLQTVIKSVAINQAQIVADMHTVYVAAKHSGYFDESEKDFEIDKDDSDSDDHGGSGAGGGMGGMIN